MNIFELVKEYEVITIFRHQAADMDALGSQFGLKTVLEEVYPDKKVYALGESLGGCKHLFPSIDLVEDEQIKNSIAIVLDTANSERIDDERFKYADCIVKIDHHIVVEEYAKYSYVDVKAAATCEILTSMFCDMDYKPSKLAATYLYYGLLSDSLSFSTTNTTSKTLKMAAYLVDCGIDVSEVRLNMSGRDINNFYYVNDIRNRVILEGNVAYAIMKEEDYKKYGFSYNEAKEHIFAMADVNQFKVWCLFTEDKTFGENHFNGSLRSKKVAINEVANKYHGGGHKNACGVKNLTLDEIQNIVKDLNELI